MWIIRLLFWYLDDWDNIKDDFINGDGVVEFYIVIFMVDE